jgi:hypothetical protein
VLAAGEIQSGKRSGRLRHACRKRAGRTGGVQEAADSQAARSEGEER